MTGRRRTLRTLLAPSPHSGRTGGTGGTRTIGAAAAVALVLCASLTAGCGVVPGATGGSGGGPIAVMTWAPQGTDTTNKPGMPAMALAYAKWINAHGGVHGRELKVLTCNDHNDSVSAAQCAQRAVDAGVVAVVGSYSQFTDSYSAPLESAGIPYIGGYGVTNDEFTGPLSYPVNGGQPALLAGLGKALAASCGRVALVRPDTVAGDELPVLLDSGLEAGRHGKAGDQLAEENSTDFDDQAARALRYVTAGGGREGCVVPALGDRTDTFMDSFRRAREDFPPVRLAATLGSVDQTVINATGGAAGPYEGAYISGWYPPASDARWDAMKKVIDEEAFGDTRIDPADAGVQTTWIACTVLRAVLDRLGAGPVSAGTVRHALDGGLRISTGGLTPPLRWQTYAGPLASVGFPRMVNADVTLQVVRDGRLVAAREDAGPRAGTTDVTRTLNDADVR